MGSYSSFREQWVRSVAGRTEEGLILPSPWPLGARREYRLSKTQTNEVIERVGYAYDIVFAVNFFFIMALTIVIKSEVLLSYVFAAVFVVSVVGLIILLNGLIYGITYPVLAGLSWTKAAPGHPRTKILEVIWKGDYSKPWLIVAVLALLIVLPSNVSTIYGLLVSGRISWDAVVSAVFVLATIQFCWVLLVRVKAWRAEK